MAVGPRPVVLVDTNVIIEAVRTGVWAAITGQLTIESVVTCCGEASARPAQRRGYVPVTQTDLDRLSNTHSVSFTQRAAFRLAYEDAVGMDDGEHDLFAHAFAREGGLWLLCSPDRASIRAGVRLGWGDRLCSLEELVNRVGARPSPELARHFGTAWLAAERTRFLLER